MEARALYDFNGRSSDELSFRQGDFLTVIDIQNEHHRAEFQGRTGYVPANYVELLPNPWFHGGVPRQHAEQILSRQDLPRGAFLIRASEKSGGPGAFSLSVKNTSHRNLVEHYRILKNQQGQYHLWSETFFSLNQLVHHHMQHSVSRETDLRLVEVNLNQTQQVETFQAVSAYRFKSEVGDELGFEPHTRIQVHVSVPGQEKSNLDSDWWFGHLESNPEKRGFFPKNYVSVDDQTRRKYRLNL
ncbi:Oidioi.mRNA.OKI2018_I69.chrUn_2.g17226.t1.cds [Oikopleura dioica]|uniref:Oidioi.mRNA.OKI2018_I69.chrUn_2.g17226.t1.c ds n=1 Tax=Oikopleura dioica TaxID=34765 RepID=A0ABN7TFF7_OIKDI|nr:Oidioi.mRNA.OKI2018_I69.chrUn_2.g17226.t1.cds [Oikopleura dioica]